MAEKVVVADEAVSWVVMEALIVVTVKPTA